MSENRYPSRPPPRRPLALAMVALFCFTLTSRTATAADQRWTLIDSTLVSRVQDSTYVFTMEVARNVFAAQGVQAGDVILEVDRDGQFFSGVAYAFLSGCHRESYEVSGALSSDERSIEMKGRRPVRTADCVVRAYQDDTLALFKIAATVAAPAPVTAPPANLPAAGPPTTNRAPSFACSGRLAPDEATICADPALAGLDVQLDAAFRRLRAQLDPAQFVRLRDDQRAWINQRHLCMTDRNCLATSFRSRITQLGNWR